MANAILHLLENIRASLVDPRPNGRLTRPGTVRGGAHPATRRNPTNLRARGITSGSGGRQHNETQGNES